MSSTARTITAARLCVAVVAAAIIIALTAATAFADPIADAKAQAAKVQAQVGALTDKAEMATEQYNLARARYNTASKQAAASARTLKKVTAQRNALQETLDTRATALYRQGPLGVLGVLFAARTFSDFDAAYQMLTNATYRDAKTVDTLKAAKDEADRTHTRLVAQQTTADVQQRSMASNAATVKTQLAKSKQVLAQANTQVRTLIAQQKAAEAAAARAEAMRLAEAARRRASYSSDNGGHSSSSDSANWGNPPTSGAGAKAVWYAEKKLGCPYRWAAAGPDEFDCSGLVMWAYKQVGIDLPHYSREQINCGTRVSKSNLEPGDLVFFGSPIHHVGMYVGSGDFIEAPYSGVDVRITKLSHRDDFAGACRPK